MEGSSESFGNFIMGRCEEKLKNNEVYDNLKQSSIDLFNRVYRALPQTEKELLIEYEAAATCINNITSKIICDIMLRKDY
jgi:hypothetical protein